MRETAYIRWEGLYIIREKEPGRAWNKGWDVLGWRGKGSMKKKEADRGDGETLPLKKQIAVKEKKRALGVTGGRRRRGERGRLH